MFLPHHSSLPFPILDDSPALAASLQYKPDMLPALYVMDGAGHPAAAAVGWEQADWTRAIEGSSPISISISISTSTSLTNGAALGPSPPQLRWGWRGPGWLGRPSTGPACRSGWQAAAPRPTCSTRTVRDKSVAKRDQTLL